MNYTIQDIQTYTELPSSGEGQSQLSYAMSRRETAVATVSTQGG